VTRIGTFFAVVGVVGSLCGAVLLYTLDFHLVLRAWAAELAALSQPLLAAPGATAEAKFIAIGLYLLGGGSGLLATGVGVLLAARAIGETRQVRPRVEHSVREASVPGMSR
jgi:hypothetical protein